MTNDITYRDAGIDYRALDSFKRNAQWAAFDTGRNVKRYGYSELPETRGESVHLVQVPGSIVGLTPEGLGTKNLVADEMRRLTRHLYYDSVAYDAVAATVNDIATSGAAPVSVGMFLAAGDAGWFEDIERSWNLIHGFRNACHDAECAWGAGETSLLPGLVMPGRVVLAAPGIGVISPAYYRIRGEIENGDRIILLESSGIHANGVSLARMIAEKLPNGYLTKLPNLRTLGESILDESRIYSPFIRRCLEHGVAIHYAVNITGHGWRKLMRSPQAFTYIVEQLPAEQCLFRFLQEHGPVSDEEAYSTFNMGAGFALYIPESSIARLNEVSAHFPRLRIIDAGYIEASGAKKVVIGPKDITLASDSLAIR